MVSGILVHKSKKERLKWAAPFLCGLPLGAPGREEGEGARAWPARPSPATTSIAATAAAAKMINGRFKAAGGAVPHGGAEKPVSEQSGVR